MTTPAHDNGNFSLSLDTAIYSLEAIKKSAYKFADRASVIINPSSGSKVTVTFAANGNISEDQRKQILTEFSNELLDQDLREIIKRETGPLRNAILAHAFSKTTLADKS